YWAEACELAGVEDIRSKKGKRNHTLYQLVSYLCDYPLANKKDAARRIGATDATVAKYWAEARELAGVESCLTEKKAI
ncbi:MAG: hypothetical protein Q4D23_09910, partial [Bacteroidales bacterium]|nr:hypothetical protein [Bacteroidales bacterium]